jgi:radical SAM superfamily enzyme YgiQ (UPF0313 family)
MPAGTLEFSRGCQYRCSFCASTNLYTRTLSYKTHAQVLQEIGLLPTFLGGRRVWFFGDDNFASHHQRAIDLSRAIALHYPKALWGCAFTAASAADCTLLDALVEGGMRYVFIGFDSIVQESLNATNKRLARASRFADVIRNLKERGIFIIAALVFGFDHDRPTVFQDTLRWALDTGVDILNLNVARPYPTTPMYTSLKQAGRLLYDPWWLQPFDVRLEMVHGMTTNVSGVMTTYQPMHMSMRELSEGTLWVAQEFYRLKRILPRLLKSAQGPTSLIVDALTTYFYAQGYHSVVPMSNPAASRDVGF